jgi:glycosyltransferase involved in cell wall biosynthesis
MPVYQNLKRIINAAWRYVTFVPNFYILKKALCSEPIDILHINNGGYPGAETCRIAALAAKHAGIPARVMSVHNLAERYSLFPILEKLIDDWVGSALNFVISHSVATQLSLERMRGFSAGRQRIIYYGIKEILFPDNGYALKRSEIGIEKDDFVVGMVGSFELRKGHYYLIKAIPEILKQYPRASFVFVGSGEYYNDMIELAKSLGVNRKTIFLGQRNDVMALMNSFDALVAPSVDFECLPYVILEAMAAGKPVVGTHVAGIPEEIEDGKTGFVVPPADTESLVSAMIKLIRSEDLQQTMGVLGRHRFEEQFTLEKMIADTDSLYDSLVGETVCEAIARSELAIKKTYARK